MVATQVIIGLWALSLQPVSAQARAGDLLRVAPGDRGFQTWLSHRYRDSTNGWHGIWRRSLDMGATLAPFLARELEQESEREHRLVLTGAYFLAARNPHAVFSRRKISDRTVRDRFMAMFALALGPRYEKGSEDLLASVEKKRLTELEQVAVCMALARIGDRGALPKQFTSKKRNPGLLASALYCRPDQRRSWVESRARRLASSGHQDLVWRGYLLGESCSGIVDRDRLALALRILRGDEGLPPVRREAAWHVAHSPAPVSVLDGLELRSLSLELQLLLSHSKLLRDAVLGGRATPQATEDRTLQRRWFALYARWASLPALRKALATWSALPRCRDPEVRRAIGLALAERWMHRKADEVAATNLDVDWLLGTDAGPWLRLARGEEATPPASGAGDASLDRALRLMAVGRLPRLRAADELRRASWRDGSHPGLTGLALHRQLLGELLIDGCSSAGPNFVDSGRKPYKAAGLGRTDRAFQVAYELFKFIRREEPWSAREHRLQY